MSFQDVCADPSVPIDANILAAVSSFIALHPSSLDEIEPHVWQEYVDIRQAIGEDCPEIEREDIWRNVHLSGVGVDVRPDDGLTYINIECNCEWEPEHGLQLVLQNGVRWVRVSDYSGHLTDGDAYACPELDVWMKDLDAKLPVRSRDELSATVGKFKRGKR